MVRTNNEPGRIRLKVKSCVLLDDTKITEKRRENL